MELKVNIDSNAVAQQLLQSMTMHLHSSIVGFVRQKFTPGGWNPSFPMQGPGMTPPQHPGVNMGGTPSYQSGPGYEQPPQQYPYPYPQPPAQFQLPVRYYSPEFFKNYSDLMDQLSTDETLITRLETIIGAHVQEFLNQSSTLQHKF